MNELMDIWTTSLLNYSIFIYLTNLVEFLSLELEFKFVKCLFTIRWTEKKIESEKINYPNTIYNKNGW